MRGWAALAALFAAAPAGAQVTCGAVLPIYQFPADAIPRIDGDPSDWDEVPARYIVGTDRLAADDGSGRRPDPASLSARMRVAWVKGLDRLYFLYEASDDHWDFAAPALAGDILELVVDGDRSGGPLIARFHPHLASRAGGAADPAAISDRDAWFDFQNIHAQNYHIFTPPGVRDWAMAWGPQAGWIKRLPWSNIAFRHDLKPGGAGRLTAEFWITPFDLASPDGPAASVPTGLAENALIGLAWAVIDADGPGRPRGFWNLSPKHTMYGQASELCAFRLMPIEPGRSPRIAADWSFAIVDRDRRLVAFHDDSRGATAWRWTFGDGTTSSERDPIHRYDTDGKFIVLLDVTGPGGSARLAKVWDVSFTGDPPR